MTQRTLSVDVESGGDDELTVGDALAQLLAVQGWTHLPLAKDGLPYGPGFFHKRNWFRALSNHNRRVSFRLQRYGRCLRCAEELPEDSTGDHLVPRSRGGPDDAQNYAPLCKRCNVGKRARDFAEWWTSSGLSLASLPQRVAADVLCAYARLRYRLALDDGDLDSPAPSYLCAFLSDAKSSLVPRSHLSALGRVRGSNDERRR